MRKALAAVIFLALAGCNDLTEPTPEIRGEYAYDAMNPASPSARRRGTLTIFDDDLRTARFSGTFSYVDAQGTRVEGQLTGAFKQRDRIWFQFLNERFVYHEAEYVSNFAQGELYLQGLTYESSGWLFTLSRVR